MSEVPLKRKKMVSRYLFVFSQTHVNFRIPELAAICDMFGISFERELLEVAQSHLFVLEFENEDIVRKILSRATLIRAVYLILEEAHDIDELKSNISSNPTLLDAYDSPDDSWSFCVRPQGKKFNQQNISEIVTEFTNIMKNQKSPVNLRNPKREYNVIQDFSTKPETHRRAYFCLAIGDGQGALKSIYNLKVRKYIGNSTMDPELAFIQANLVQARPACLVLDPFCGTGGILIPAGHFGATVVGTEINYLVARGEGKSSRQGEDMLTKDQTIYGNFADYGLEKQYGDVIVGDASRHGLWRQGMQFDAITADPPYGIRERASKVGVRKDKDANALGPRNNHYPEKAKYSLHQSFIDIMNLAAVKLVVGGRVAFWFPVVRDTYNVDVLPRHEALQLIDNCEQVLTHRGSRRLLVYTKLREPHGDETSYIRNDQFANGTFREVIFTQGRTVKGQGDNASLTNCDKAQSEEVE